VPPPVPAPKRSSSLLPLLIIGAIGTVLLMAVAAAAIMIVLMNRGAFSPAGPPADALPAADAAPEAAPDAAPPSDATAPPDPETVAAEQAEQAAAAAAAAAAAEAAPSDGAPPAAAREADVESGPASRADAANERAPGGERTARPGSRLGSRPGGFAEAPPPPPPPMPVRVGGSIRAPRKTRDVAPVYPQIAQQARVQGVVILEATIDREGRVSEARVLRSIPLLDQAALDAVRQWEYEPTLLNGVAVPVIVTVTANFTLGR
jgi:protein TonB